MRTVRGVALVGALLLFATTASALLSATGLSLQTALAVYLLIWWRLNR